jgi:hypothetical protein
VVTVRYIIVLPACPKGYRVKVRILESGGFEITIEPLEPIRNLGASGAV